MKRLVAVEMAVVGVVVVAAVAMGPYSLV